MQPNETSATTPQPVMNPTTTAGEQVATPALENQVSEEQLAELQKLEEKNNAFFNSQGGIDKVRSNLEDYQARLRKAEEEAELRRQYTEMRQAKSEQHLAQIEQNPQPQYQEQPAFQPPVAQPVVPVLPKAVINNANESIRSALLNKFPELQAQISDGSFFTGAQEIGVPTLDENSIFNQEALERYAQQISVFAKQAQSAGVSSAPQVVSRFNDYQPVAKGAMTKAMAMEIIAKGQDHPEYQRAINAYHYGDN